MLIIIDSMLKWVKGLNIRKSRVQNSYITTNWGGGGGGGGERRKELKFLFNIMKYIKNIHFFSWGIIM